MAKVHLLLFLLGSLYFISSPSVAAEFSVEDEFKAMKAQIDMMHRRIEGLEKKQEIQMAEHKIEKEMYEGRIKELEDRLVQHDSHESEHHDHAPSEDKKIEISAVADTVFTSTSSKEDEEGANRLSVRELALILGGQIDPLSRLDAIIAFSDFEEVMLEEAYLTRAGLPFDSTARLGRIKPNVGQALKVHRHHLETVDEPIVIQRYFGVEGMSKSGLDITTPIDLPWSMNPEMTLGVLEGGNGEDGTAFGTTSRAPTLYSHLKNDVNLTDTTALELGVSHMAGSGGDEPGFDAQIIGADVALIQQFGEQALKWQNEVFNLNRRKSVDVDGNLWGAYSLLDYRFHPQWSAGFRYDYAELVDNPEENPHNADIGQTGYVTFHQSEFARWRLQYNHAHLAGGKDDHTVYVQGTFVIGDHKEHEY